MIGMIGGVILVKNKIGMIFHSETPLYYLHTMFMLVESQHVIG